MSIAGKVIVVNHPNPKCAEQIVKAVQDLEKQVAYFHVGCSTLTKHFLPENCSALATYLPALYCAISATARTGANVLADLSICSSEQYQRLKAYLKGLDVAWVSFNKTADWEPTDLSLSDTLSTPAAAEHILDFIQKQYRYAESYARWVPEKIPVSEVYPFGKIILLIGSSSSGKTTLASNLQNMAPEVFLKVGVDTAVLEYTHLRYIAGVPEKKNDSSWQNSEHETSEYHKQGSSWVAAGVNTLNPHPHLRYRMGPVARLSFSATYATMAAVSRQGFNVVSDHCFHFQNSLDEARHYFKDLPVTYVRLHPSLEILNQREVERGDRMIGMAESVYYQMVNDYEADLELDTGILSSEDCANTILTLISNIK